MMDKSELARQRVRISLQGHQPFAASVQAVYDTLSALRDGVLPAELENVASKETMSRLTGKPDIDDKIDRFLT